MNCTYYIHILDMDLERLDLSMYNNAHITSRADSSRVTLKNVLLNDKLEKRCMSIDCSITRVDCDSNETEVICSNDLLPIIIHITVDWGWDYNRTKRF